MLDSYSNMSHSLIFYFKITSIKVSPTRGCFCWTHILTRLIASFLISRWPQFRCHQFYLLNLLWILSSNTPYVLCFLTSQEDEQSMKTHARLRPHEYISRDLYLCSLATSTSAHWIATHSLTYSMSAFLTICAWGMRVTGFLMIAYILMDLSPDASNNIKPI